MSQATELIARQMAAGSANARVWADILYNVKLYGAKGDWNGTTGTDDTAAIQATIDYAISVGGKAVFFPHGTYKVAALTGLSSVVLFGDNASFVGISTIINQIGSATSNLAINVKDYGTKGDGLVNDAAAIQGAVTAATTSGGIVFLPQGTYKISTALTVPSNVTLWFSNGANLSVDTGITVTINGPVDAGLHQIFSGLGTITGSMDVSQFYPQWWGAKGDGLNDDTTAIQAAILAAYGNGGGTVYLPRGKYKITALTLHIGVRIVGESYLSNNVFPGATDHRGTWIYCTDTVNPAILMYSTTKIQNVSFFYPNQVTNAVPVAYPPTIKTATSHVKFTIQEVMLQNSYIGIECNTSHENLTIDRVQGLPIFQGIVVDQGSDLDRISDVNFSWNCWYEAGDILKRWIVDNGIAFTIRKTDWGYLTGSNCFGYNVGLLVENSPVSGVPSGFNFSRLGFDACVKPMRIIGGVGLKFSQIIPVQYHYFDLTLAGGNKAIELASLDNVVLEDIHIGTTYGHGITLSNCKSVKIGNVIMSEFGRATPTNPSKFGIFLIGGNSKITIKDSFIDGKSNPSTYGIFVTGTLNDRLIINENHVSNVVIASIFLDAGSANYVICKHNQFQNSGLLADNLGAVTKDVASNMG